jgi:hypothetical protein
MKKRILTVFLLFSFDITFAADDEARYAAVDRHALQAPPSATKSVAALSSYLTKPFATDEEKARAIFRWITENITYDVEAFFSGRIKESRSADILKSRSSVCGGYSSLFEVLGRKAGLNVITISGFAKGYLYKPGDRVTRESNHAWNAIRIQGEWKFIDCTWGAGKVDDKHNYIKAFESYYFFTKPEEFIYRHLPEEKRWQLLPEPLSRQEFQNLPFVSPPYFQNSLKLKGMQTVQLDVDSESLLEISAPPEIFCTTNLEKDGNEVPSAVFLQRIDSIVQVRIKPPGKGEYILNIFAVKGTDMRLLPQAISFKVIAHSDIVQNNAFPCIYGTYMETNAHVQSPLTKELPSGSMQMFSLKAPGAQKIAISCGEEMDFLKKSGNQFEGMVEIDIGKVIVYGQYPGRKEFQALLEYTGTGSIKRIPGPIKSETFINSGAEVLSPLKKELPAGSEQFFRLKIPRARKVAVARGEDWQYLDKNEDYFEGTVDIGKGRTIVVAAFISTSIFEGLLEYEGK